MRWRDALIVILLPVSVPVWGQSTEELLRQTIEYAHDTGDLRLGGANLSAINFLARFYQARRFKPAWTDPVNVADALNILQSGDRHGLRTQDFHVDNIRLLQAMAAEQSDDGRLNAILDLLLTDGLVTFAYQLVYGKLDPRAIAASWNLPRPLLKKPPEQVLEKALAERALPAVAASLVPEFSYYRGMLAQLERYRQFVRRGGWPAVPEGRTLRPGVTDPHVAILRARLAVEYDDTPIVGSDPEFFGTALADAIRNFQRRHGLTEDGRVGPSTLGALNITAGQRVDQIRVNLERARWLGEEFTSANRFLLVNIAGLYLQLFEGGTKAWESRVIVGTPYNQTPVFAADMKYIVFNPTWSVPLSIIRDEMLPGLKRDPTFLAAQHFDLVGPAGGSVDPASVDWTRVTANNFPYSLVQRPGPENALGKVKFILPNEHAVYLHDTPARQLFSRAGRTFSHGCVRTQNPLRLATLLLARQPDWTRSAIDQVLASGETRTVFLDEPLPVFFLYRTAAPAQDGHVRFFDDVYRRDGGLLKALDAPSGSLTPVTP